MDAYIVDGVRSAIGNAGGALSGTRADDLAAIVIRQLLQKYKQLPASEIDDVIMGCSNQAGEDNRNVARMALLLAGLPYTVPGKTVNRLCASGMQAIADAAANIQTGDANIIIAAGVENMTRAPWVLSKSSKPFGSDAQLFDSSFGWRFINPAMQQQYGTDAMGITAENLAAMYQISRADQDLYAYRSQMKATAASNNGRLDMEITPIEIAINKSTKTLFNKDEFIKPFTSLEGLAKLKPAFSKENGTVTAGNASGINDGAAAVLIVSEKALQQYGLVPLAKIRSYAVIGCEPRIMGIGPVAATKKAVVKAGLHLKDMDIIELNEAFAAQSIACIREWGLPDDDASINPNGGAIALGHPLGMSGTRIVYSAALELKLQNKKYALATMCIGVGQGAAMVLENCNYKEY
jgi:3-oxoadipyl-CoA thiolase